VAYSGTTLALCSSFRVRNQFQNHFVPLYILANSRVSSGSIVSEYGLDDRAIGVRSPAGQMIFPLSSVSRPALGPTQSPVQWEPRVLSSGVKRGRGVTLTIHPHLVRRLTMSRSYTSSTPSASMACSVSTLHFIYILARYERLYPHHFHCTDYKHSFISRDSVNILELSNFVIVYFRFGIKRK
jgi:hypothetical protein